MKKKSIYLLFALSIAAVLIAALSIAVRIAAGESAGREAAKRNFDRLVTILAPVRTAQDLADPGLRSRLAGFYRESPNLLLVTVYEKGNGVKWRIPARSDYLPARENVNPIPETQYPPQSAFLLSAPLASDVSGKLAVDALYVALPQARLFNAFRDATFALSACLLLLSVYLLIALVAERKAGSAAEAASETPNPEAGIPSDTDFEMEESALENDFDIPSLSDEVQPASIVLGEGATPSLGKATPFPGKPEGLYSPLSGLGWESYIADRLNAELARSASFEQDLSLLAIAYPGLSPEKPEYPVMAKSIAEFFNFKDLSFEHGPDGFVVILPDMDSEHGLKIAGEFLKKVESRFPKATKEGKLPPVYMGLSSRSGRLIDGLRLEQEAMTSLHKAIEDADSHIVAFRPDPDKYRLYLASKGL